jgi:hypothetical protein
MIGSIAMTKLNRLYEAAILKNAGRSNEGARAGWR